MRCWKDQLMKILMNSALNKLFKTQSSTDWMCRLVSLQRNSDESDLKLKLRQRDGAARRQRLFFFCQRRWKRNEGQKKRKREKTEREKGRGQSVKQPMTQVMKEWVHSAGWRWVRDGGHRHHHIFKSKKTRRRNSSYSFVGFLLAGVFRGFAGIRADLHVHGVDDVEEILHHRHALQGRVHARHAVHTLETDQDKQTKSNSQSVKNSQ